MLPAKLGGEGTEEPTKLPATAAVGALFRRDAPCIYEAMRRSSSDIFLAVRHTLHENCCRRIFYRVKKGGGIWVK